MNLAVGGLVAFVAGLVSALVLTPVAALFAARLGILDRPDGHRKIQAGVTPLGGGLAVAVASVIGLIAVIVSRWATGTVPVINDEQSFLVSLLPAAFVIIVIGLIDDIWSLTGIYKLIGQVFAVSLLLAAGFEFQRVSLFGATFNLGNLAIPFTMFFCLTAINAFNLIDGVDGLASSVGALVLATLGVLSAARGELAASTLCLAMAGALSGFLKYNFVPAKIYLGDTGSMLIGLLVGTVAVHCSIKEQTAMALSVPIAICAIPFLDAFAALIRRVTTGQSVFSADRGHLHHALLQRGWPIRETVGFIAFLTAITCGGALATYFTKSDLLAVVTTVGVIVTLAASRIFGHVEVALLAARIRSAARQLARFDINHIKDAQPSSESLVRMQGSRHWQSIWMALRKSAEDHHLLEIRLNINIPHLHESYYATWESRDSVPKQASWRLQIPLQYHGREAGRLTLAGHGAGSDALNQLQIVVNFLKPLDDQLERLAIGGNEPLKDDVRVAVSTVSFNESFPKPVTVAASPFRGS